MVVAKSAAPQAEMAYPLGEMVSVNPDDPPGVHALVLMASRSSHSKDAELLEARYRERGEWAPPAQLPQRWAVKLRGPGGTRPAPSNLYPSKYVQAIKDRMPPGFELVYILFLETKK
jgi:hypothetical protein